jgi:hypothetical protein
MGATRGATATWQSGNDGTTRWQALIGALAGALAVSGSLLTWATVGRSGAIHGTSYALGILTLVCGIVMLAGGVALILVSQPRTRTATALAIAAMGLTVVITIGTGLATGTLLDQAPGKAARHHRPGKISPSTSPTAVGLAHLVPGYQHAVGSGRADGSTPRSLPRVVVPNAGTTFQALAKGGRKGRVTLGPGPFIGLVGGLLGLVAGLWALLSSRANRAVLVATAPGRATGESRADRAPPTASSYVSTGDAAAPPQLLDPRRALSPGSDAPGGYQNPPGTEPPR